MSFFRCIEVAFLVLTFSTAAFGNPPQDPKSNQAAAGQPCDKSSDKPCTTAPPPNYDFEAAEREFMALGKTPDPEAVKRGRAIYVPTCGFCHGSMARGGSGGPNLVRSVLVMHDRGTGSEIAPVVHNGRTEKGMPAFPRLQDAQIKDIAAFLFSLIQSNANRHDYKILNIVTGDAAKGEAYFKAHCANCHSPTGDLAHIAKKFEAVALQSRFLYPKTDWYPGMPPRDPKEMTKAAVTLASGQTYTGVAERRDDFSITITDASGQRHSWSYDDEPGIQVELKDPLKAHRDMLPNYTDEDMHNILAYLETLK